MIRILQCPSGETCYDDLCTSHGFCMYTHESPCYDPSQGKSHDMTDSGRAEAVNPDRT